MDKSQIWMNYTESSVQLWRNFISAPKDSSNEHKTNQASQIIELIKYFNNIVTMLSIELIKATYLSTCIYTNQKHKYIPFYGNIVNTRL